MAKSIWQTIKAQIKFVRHYKWAREDIFDVVYITSPRRCRTYYGWENLPKTVKRFIDTHEPQSYMDKFHGEEHIYENKEALYGRLG